MRFNWKLSKPATDALDPINVTTTRGAVICGLKNRIFENRIIFSNCLLFNLPDQCKSILQITAAAGNRLAHPLFSELSRLGKRFHKSETTQSSLITLSGIVKVSHLLRPIRPGFMFSVPCAEAYCRCLCNNIFFHSRP